MNVPQLLAEMNELKTFFERQIEKGHDISNMANNQLKHFEKKVRKLPTLDATDANKLVDTFETARFPDECKLKFSQVVADKLMGGNDDIYDNKGSLSQHIRIEHYLTEQKTNELASASIDISVKTNFLAEVYADLGCFHACEPSIARGAIILGTHGIGSNTATANTLHNLHLDLKQALTYIREERASTFRFGYIKQYPDDPLELPQDRLTHAYGDVMPVAPSIQMKTCIHRLSQLKFMRSSSKALRETPPPTSTGFRIPSGSQAMDPNATLITSCFKHLSEQMMQMNRGMLGNGDDRDRRDGVRDERYVQDRSPGRSQCGHQRPSSRSMHGFTPRVEDQRARGTNSRTSSPRDSDGSRSLSPHAQESTINGKVALEDRKDKKDVPSKHNDDEASDGSHTELLDPVKAQREKMKAILSEGREAAADSRKKAKAAAKAAAKETADLPIPKKTRKAAAVADAAKAAGAKCGAAGKGVAKRPAAAGAAGGARLERPPLLTEEHTTVWYMGGKIQKSCTKGGFRTFAKHPNPVDKVIRWENNTKAAHQAAWDEALDYIELIRGPQ